MNPRPPLPPDDPGLLQTLNHQKRISAFCFSEDPLAVGLVGEALARALDGAARHVDLHLWASATPYRGLSSPPRGIPLRTATKFALLTGQCGGSWALSQRLRHYARGRVSVDRRSHLPSLDQSTREKLADDFNSLPLTDIAYRNSRIGWTVYGSLTHLTGSSRPMEIVSSVTTESMLVSYATVFNAAMVALRLEQPDVALVYNGRLLHEAAVVHAGRELGIETIIAEVGRNHQSISLYAESPLDLPNHTKRLLTAWAQAARSGDEYRRQLAAQWFSRRRPSPDAVNRFVGRQQIGVVPARRAGVRRVTFYTTSTDEYQSTGPDWTSPYGTQDEVLKRLSERARYDRQLELVVRVHPHTIKKNRLDQQVDADFLRSLGEHVRIIPADSACDSYSLAESSDLVLSMCSTMVVEAAFLGIPSMPLGPAPYSDLIGCVSLNSVEDSLYTEMSGETICQRKEQALIYGFYEATFGIPLKYFDATPPIERFMGRPLSRLGKWQRLVPHSVWANHIAASKAHLGIPSEDI